MRFLSLTPRPLQCASAERSKAHGFYVGEPVEGFLTVAYSCISPWITKRLSLMAACEGSVS